MNALASRAITPVEACELRQRAASDFAAAIAAAADAARMSRWDADAREQFGLAASYAGERLAARREAIEAMPSAPVTFGTAWSFPDTSPAQKAILGLTERQAKRKIVSECLARAGQPDGAPWLQLAIDWRLVRRDWDALAIRLTDEGREYAGAEA